MSDETENDDVLELTPEMEDSDAPENSDAAAADSDGASESTGDTVPVESSEKSEEASNEKSDADSMDEPASDAAASDTGEARVSVIPLVSIVSAEKTDDVEEGEGDSEESAETDEDAGESKEDDILDLGAAQMIPAEQGISAPANEIPMARISGVPPEPTAPVAPPVADGEESAVDETFDLAEAHVVEEGRSIPDTNEAPVEHAFDFGTPGMVFDEVPAEETAGSGGEEDDYDVEVADSASVGADAPAAEAEETVAPGMPPLPEGAVLNTGPQDTISELELAQAQEEAPAAPAAEPVAEEELDIAEIEEVAGGPPKPPPPKAPPSAEGPGGRPIDSFFKEDAVAKANAAIKLEARVQKSKPRRKLEWWASIFDDEYLMLLPERSAYEEQKQIDFIQKTLGLPKGKLILDLACGIGPNSIGLVQRGYRAVGVDLSLSMLARAGDAAQDAGVKINFIHGDMRDLGFDKTFDAVICMNTSFGFFDEQTNMKVLQGVYRALKPGGVFLLELSNRDFVVRQQPNMVWFQMDNMVCMEETDFNYINNRLYISRQLIIGDNERQTKHEFSLRLFSLNEIGQLLHHAGFAVVKVSGHRATPGAFFGPESAKMIIVAERRGD